MEPSLSFASGEVLTLTLPNELKLSSCGPAGLLQKAAAGSEGSEFMENQNTQLVQQVCIPQPASLLFLFWWVGQFDSAPTESFAWRGLVTSPKCTSEQGSYFSLCDPEDP